MIGNKTRFVISYTTENGDIITLGVVESWELERWTKYLNYRIEKGTAKSYTIKEL